MLYTFYEMSHAAFGPARAAADGCRMMLRNPLNPLTHTPIGRQAAAVCEVFERATRQYEKPIFGLENTKVDGKSVAVTEDIVFRRPFCKVIRFKRDLAVERDARDPKLLIIAPMSGHYATLLRGTVEAFLPTHDVYITDWLDAGEVPLSVGRFDLDDYIDTVRDIFRHFDGDVHVYSVCQPSVAVLATVALMEADGETCLPRSVSMAGGPIDTRRSPTVVNTLAVERGTEWFRTNVLTTVPWTRRGAGRRVYPGFLQLSGFITMNLDKHMTAHKDMFLHLVHGDGDNADKHREFYDEYLAVMDLTAEFYMQTVDTVFVNHHLPRGLMVHRGKKVDLKKIRRVPLMTIEGEKDDITGIGQCSAALELCSSLPANMKQHFECPKVGHYGVFNGSRFRSQIVPRLSQFMRRFDPRGTGKATVATMKADAEHDMRHDLGRGSDFAHAAFAFALPPGMISDADGDVETSLSRATVVPFGGVMPVGLSAQLAALRFWNAASGGLLGSAYQAANKMSKPDRKLVK